MEAGTEMCPNCGSTSLRYRKTIHEHYICKRCNYAWNEEDRQKQIREDRKNHEKAMEVLDGTAPSICDYCNGGGEDGWKAIIPMFLTALYLLYIELFWMDFSLHILSWIGVFILGISVWALTQSEYRGIFTPHVSRLSGHCYVDITKGRMVSKIIVQTGSVAAGLPVFITGHLIWNGISSIWNFVA